MAPHLALLYTSLGGASEIGVGWQFESGRIERSSSSGVPRFDDTDTFVFSMGGSQSELVRTGPRG